MQFYSRTDRVLKAHESDGEGGGGGYRLTDQNSWQLARLIHCPDSALH